MVERIHIYLFGDQTENINANLRALLLSNNNCLLTSFFERACHALRAEIGLLPHRDRVTFPRFSTIAELLSIQRSGVANPALDQALTCVYQFGCFISQHGETGDVYPLTSETYLLGLCTGSLPAAAISCCESISQLIPLAVQTVLIALRTGLCAANVGNRIEKPAEGLSSWSTIVHGLTGEDIPKVLKDFSEANSIPITSRPYISARASNSMTISGPPSTLAALRNSRILGKRSSIDLSVHAPYHAPHLFSSDDIQTILATTQPGIWSHYTAHIGIVSSSTGNLTWAGNFRSLLQAALSDILLEPLRWDNIGTRVAKILRLSGALKFNVRPIATNAEQALLSSLNQVEQYSNEYMGQLPEKEIYPTRTICIPAGQETPSGRPEKSKIAIIGMSGRFPDAECPESFWDLLSEGLDVCREVPSLRWDAKTHVDVSGSGAKKNTSATPYGCWLNNAGMFDAPFFNMSPREAPQVDPAQRLALLTAYEALEQAGIVPEATPSTQSSRVGVFYGITSNDWMETNSAQNIDTYFIPGGNRAFVPGRINYHFKFSGPSYSIDTACSSSLAAIHTACNYLWRGEIDTAIAGGTNVLTNPDFTAGLDRGHFLSRTGNCKTFDDEADGYCRGEAVGTVILKRLEDAIADNDPIQGLILGAYTNHSAEAESITRPHVGAQKAVFDKLLNGSGIDPFEISYVEMHGTGTQAGDAGEMQSVLESFAPHHAHQKRLLSQPLYLGSAKANIGHGEAASGVSSLAKMLLMMKKDLIPPHCGIKTKINSRFPTDLRERNVHIAQNLVSWTRPDGATRKVLVNNFSAAGGNTALLLEDAPETLDNKIGGNDIDPRSQQLVAISAKSATSLTGNLTSLIRFLGQQQDQNFSLPRLSYTTTARRMHHSHRVMVGGSNVAEIKAALETAIVSGEGMAKSRPKSTLKMVFAFTGQGSQYPAMGKQLFNSLSQFRADILRYDRIGQSHGFPSIEPIFTSTYDGGDIADYVPIVVQLASTAMQMALAQLWASWGILPGAVVGHSLGEYAALNVAGVISDSDTIYLVGTRAQLLQDQCNRGTHSMLAIKASLKVIDDLLSGKTYEVACHNGPEEVVLSGTNEDIRIIKGILSAHSLKMSTLKVPFAFHSSQVDPVLDRFEAAARGVVFRKPSIPVICPLYGNVVSELGTFTPQYLVRHCRHTVNMADALRAAGEAKIITDRAFVLELGPHPAVSSMVKATLGSNITILSTLRRNCDTWTVVTKSLSILYCAGAEIRWAEYHHDFKSCHKVLELPAYSWDLKNYWMQYVNDWSLRKGDPLPATLSFSKPLEFAETTTVHKKIEETVTDNVVTLVVESDISRSDLNPLVQGHKVNGVPLCTPSVYADIALTLGTYLLDRYQKDMRERLVDVADMIVDKALIAKPHGPQKLQTNVVAHWASKIATMNFYSINDEGQKTVEHAHCTVRFVDRSQMDDLKLRAQEIKAQMKQLRSGLENGHTQRFNKTMVYRMVATLAQFHPDYRAIEEVILDSKALEASTLVNFADVKKGGTFNTHPAFIDGLTQSGGFVMNANDGADPDIEVFVNHGWESFQLFEEISATKSYRTHVKMSRRGGTMWGGDVVVFDGDNIAASFKNVLLQGVPRRVLHYILAEQSGAKPSVRSINNTVMPAAAQVSAAAQVAKASQATETRKAPLQYIIGSALRIISEESGIPVDELTDGSVFSDMGVDSLLSLTIASRFREELELDIEIDSMFTEFPSVKDLKDFLQGVQQPLPDSASPIESTRVLVPEMIENGMENCAVVGASDAVVDFTSALRIISEESGVPTDELTDDCIFSDMGIDSLLSLIIASRFREELSLDLDVDSMFTTFPTVKHLRDCFLAQKSNKTTSDHSVDSTQDADSLTSSPFDRAQPDTSIPAELSLSRKVCDTPETDASDTSYFSSSIVHTGRTYPVPSVTSVILQGLPQNAMKILFLLPDGGGSCASYASIPRVNSNICIIGLNSPYMRNGQDMKCTVDELVDKYLAEIRRRQPNGPYDLGGWSAGGILAYRVAQQLIAQGEEIHTLVLIDAPVPKGLDKVPQHFYDYCNTLGLFGQAIGASAASAPEWLIPHFNATIDVLHDYFADPLPEGQTPLVSIIWACDGVMDGKSIPKLLPQPGDTEGMKFLSETRTDFSAQGWADLFPGGKVRVEKAIGANHFSMMKGEHAFNLARFIERALV